MVGRKKRLWRMARVLLVIPFVIVLSPYALFVAEKQPGPLYEMFWYSVFGRITSGEIQTIVMSMEMLGVLFLFALLFGTWISSHFDGNSHMTFTRIARREVWSLKCILEVWGLAALYAAAFLGLKLVVDIRRVEAWSLDLRLAGAVCTVFGMVFPLLALTCLVSNWIAIHKGIAIGVLVSFAAVLVLMELAINWFDVPAMTVFNPLCANLRILDTPGLAAGKVGINMAYLLLVTAGMTLDIKYRDIF